MLSYARQVLELEKIAALAPRPPVLAPLGVATELGCVVSAAARARLCASCSRWRIVRLSTSKWIGCGTRRRAQSSRPSPPTTPFGRALRSSSWWQSCCAALLSGRRSRPGLYRKSAWVELGRPDLVVGFNAGLLLYRSWEPTLLDLVGSGVPLAITSYRAWEAEAEARLLESFGASLLQPPAPNPFASRCSRRSSTRVNDFSRDNAFLAIWR